MRCRSLSDVRPLAWTALHESSAGDSNSVDDKPKRLGQRCVKKIRLDVTCGCEGAPRYKQLLLGGGLSTKRIYSGTSVDTTSTTTTTKSRAFIAWAQREDQPSILSPRTRMGHKNLDQLCIKIVEDQLWLKGNPKRNPPRKASATKIGGKIYGTLVELKG